jgi:hypothetical protein
MVVGLIPSSSRCGARKFDDKDPLRHWVAFQQIDLAAAGDDAPTKTGNCRQSARHMRLIGGGVGYVNIADDVVGIAPSLLVPTIRRSRQFGANHRAAATSSALKKE